MQKNEQWLKMLPLNRIECTIQLANGTFHKSMLRFTKHQQEQYNEINKQENADIADLAYVILNPEPNKIDISKEEIENALDLDEIKLLISVWINKKVVAPSLSQKLDQAFF